MNVPTRRIELKELDAGYGDQWVDVPRGLTEGVLHDIQRRNIDQQRLTAKIAAETDAEKRIDLEQEELEWRRETSSVVLGVIVDWNLTGADGKKLPLPSAAKGTAAKVAALQPLPLEVIRLLSDTIWNPSRKAVVPEETKDFSSASSGEQEAASSSGT